jgi:hypothetical protein
LGSARSFSPLHRPGATKSRAGRIRTAAALDGLPARCQISLVARRRNHRPKRAEGGVVMSVVRSNPLKVLACTTSLLLAAVVLAADTSVQVNGVEIGNQQQPNAEDKPSQSTCVNHCNAADTKCNSEVRRARQECSRIASTGGRDPMTMRTNDYTYFCGYFGNGGLHCGSDYYSRGCQSRFSYRYGVCIDTMQNIAAMRYDCYKAERDSQNMCREELRECKAACGQ